MGRESLKEITTAEYRNDGQVIFGLKDSNNRIYISIAKGREKEDELISIM
ncbi:hypothetical protein [Mycoplasma wenyonii]|nr:hypothetical protein [Mycoplasma wenyonii]